MPRSLAPVARRLTIRGMLRPAHASRAPAYSAASSGATLSPSAMRIASSSTAAPAPARGACSDDVAAEGARARPAVVKAQDVPGDIVEPAARAQVPLGVGDQGLDHLAARGRGRWRRRTAAGRPRPADRGSGRRRGRARRRPPSPRCASAASSEVMPPLMHDLQLGMRRLEPIHARHSRAAGSRGSPWATAPAARPCARAR